MRVLASLLLAASAAPAPQDALPLPAAEVRALTGRVTLYAERERTELTRTLGTRRVRGLGLAEAGPAAGFEAAWRGWGSLRARGRSSLSFAVDAPPEGKPTVELELRHFDRLEVETRRGRFRLALPEGWGTEVHGAALSLKQRVDGTLELHHRGGEPVVVRDRAGRGGRWPRRLVGGQSLLLPPLEERVGSRAGK